MHYPKPQRGFLSAFPPLALALPILFPSQKKHLSGPGLGAHQEVYTGYCHHHLSPRELCNCGEVGAATKAGFTHQSLVLTAVLGQEAHSLWEQLSSGLQGEGCGHRGGWSRQWGSRERGEDI